MPEESRTMAEDDDFVAKAMSDAGYAPSPGELAQLTKLYPLVREMVARLRSLAGVEEDAPALVLDLHASDTPAQEH